MRFYNGLRENNKKTKQNLILSNQSFQRKPVSWAVLYWPSLPSLKYLKASLSKGTTFINAANDWIGVGTGHLFPSVPCQEMCLFSWWEMLPSWRAALNHIGHKVAFAFAVRLPSSTLFNPSDMLRGGAECQKINRKKHASGRHAWPPKPHILDRLNIYSGRRLACHDVGKWLSLWTGNMLLCVLYLANKAILTLIVSS